MKNGSIFRIDYIGFKDEYPVILGKHFINLKSIPGYPCNSQDMEIHIASKGIHLEIIPIKEISKKAFTMFFNNVYYIMPLLHL